MDDGKNNEPGEESATAIDTVWNDPAMVLAAMYRSWLKDMNSRLYFPLYGETEDERWALHPNREAIDELPFYEDVTLFEAALLIGDRILDGPWSLVGKGPELFTRELFRGEIDPRHPTSGLRFSDDPGDVPDLRWGLPRKELQAFAMLRWDREVYTDAEMTGGEHCEAPADEHQSGADINMPRRERRATTDRKLLEVIAALLASMPRNKWPNGKDLENAAQSVGISITDDTCRKAMEQAKEIMTHPPPNPPK